MSFVQIVISKMSSVGAYHELLHQVRMCTYKYGYTACYP